MGFKDVVKRYSTPRQRRWLRSFPDAINGLVIPGFVRKWVHVGRLRRADKTKINFGCGYEPLPGWLNTDGGDGSVFAPPAISNIIKLDVWKFFKHVPDNSARFISSEQFYEHFDRYEGFRMAQEWFRILKPGGVLRIQTVDLEVEIDVYLDRRKGVSWQKDVLPHRLVHIAGSADSYGKLMKGEKYVRAMHLNNTFNLDGHKCIYDFELISQTLTRAGFTDIKRVKFGHSSHKELRGIDKHDGGPTGRHWIPDGVLLVEANKP